MAFGQFSAHLLSPTAIRVVLFSEKYHYEQARVVIYDEDGAVIPFNLKSKTTHYKVITYQLELMTPFVLGSNYKVSLQNFGQVPLNVSEATTWPTFDEDFFYSGELGPIYSKKETIFRLWAPLASRVILKYRVATEEQFLYRRLKRIENGVYEYTLKGDHEGLPYSYLVLNNGVEEEVSDPYAKSSGPNGRFSYVIDLTKLKCDFNDDKLPAFSSPTEAIIYETSVRDQTVDERADIENKATFYGMSEKGRKVKGLYPAGFDYLKSLGITHLQLLPVYDFATVDELNKWDSYNWGYDPQQYFVLEGSYGRDPLDPYNRIKDFQAMVATYHEAGMRIVLDVVFNHVYNYETSVFEKIVPNYYFRKTSEGIISNGSGVGNDFATERPMISRLIVDVVNYYVGTLGVDGFRFDLMGLIDIKTIRTIETEVRKFKPNFLLYGEGWEMATTLDRQELATHSNARSLSEVGFFNDSYREIMKGASFSENIRERGYLLGATNYRAGFQFAYCGSVLNTTFAPRFMSASQSINYVECHDNMTIIDKLLVSNSYESLDVHLTRIQSLNTIIMLSFGVPFFHRGQEIGVSKYGDHNSYKSSDKVNQFPYTLAYKRSAMVEYFKTLVALRKDCPFLHESDPKVIKELVTFNDLNEGGVEIVYNPSFNLAPYREFRVYVNPSGEPIFVDLEKPLKIVLNRAGYIAARSSEYIQRVMVAPYSVIVLGERNESSNTK